VANERPEPAGGRERRRARSSTRERLLQAADRLWSERGLQGASLEDIAREAAVTKPTLYYYFADKSGLFTETVCSVLEQHGGGLRTASRAASSARARLVAAIAYLIRARCSGPRLLRDGGVTLTIDQLSQTRSAFFRHFFAPLQQILDDGVRAGELRSIDSAFATQALLNLIDPWTSGTSRTSREARPGGRTAEQLAGDIVDLVVDGIGV
jgi:AcrR family transcriptional regulator